MEYMSLQKAASSCLYSQEYLSLRARQKKLKAVKIGRNWSTTKEWLDEYIDKSEAYKESTQSNRINSQGRSFTQFEDELLERPFKQSSLLEPPLNLPIETSDADIWEDGTPEEVACRGAFQRKLQFAFATLGIVALLVTSISLGQRQILSVAEEVHPIVISSVATLHKEIAEKGFIAGAGVGEIAQRYVRWFGEQIQSIAQIFRSDTVRQGLVVTPSADNDERVKAQIKQSFSDEVIVSPHDEETGIITPVFRSRTGEDYLYILVPLQDRE